MAPGRDLAGERSLGACRSIAAGLPNGSDGDLNRCVDGVSTFFHVLSRLNSGRA